MSWYAVCSRQPGNALIAAECRRLTGGTPAADGVAPCSSIERVASSAYIHYGVRPLAQAASLPELAARVAGLALQAEGFRIELLRLATRRSFEHFEAVTTLADAIPADPDLSHPRIRFLLIERSDGLYFTEICAENNFDYRRYQSKPYHTSSSLSARLARALVSLVAPGVRSILDPCCGTGSILLQARALGLTAFGSDRNPLMVEMTRGNLAHFGFSAEVTAQDASQVSQAADAVVTDLPYGRFVHNDDANLRSILDNCARLAPQAVFAAGADLSPWLAQAGYVEIEVLQVEKVRGFIRYIHHARSGVCNPPAP